MQRSPVLTIWGVRARWQLRSLRIRLACFLELWGWYVPGVKDFPFASSLAHTYTKDCTLAV